MEKRWTAKKTAFDCLVIVAEMVGRETRLRTTADGERSKKKRKGGKNGGASENERDSAFGERGDSV